jgi:outer membrane receptor protein involved in Fe transport
MSLFRFCVPATLALYTCTLHAQTNGPATVVVKAKRADVVTKIDRKVYRADADIQASTGSAADLLNNIPAVDVDVDGNVSLRGDTSVTVLIDGMPSSQMQGAARGGALMGFSAADIEQIEIITSPSAEFKPDGAGGIINIVTKKNRKRGGAGQMLANLGTDGRHNGSVGGSYSTGTVDLSGTLGKRKDWRQRVSDSIAGTRDAVPTVSHQTLDESNDRRYGKGALKYTPNTAQTFGLTADYATRTEHRYSSQATLPGDAPAYRRDGDGGGPRTDAGLAFNAEQKLARPGEALSLYLQRSHSNESNLYDYRQDHAAPALQRDFGQQVYDVSKMTVAYVRPDDEGRTLKAGYDVEYDHNAFNDSSATGTDGALGANPAAINHFRYRQAVNAAYTTYAVKYGALEILGGLRFEQTDIQTLQKVSGDRSAQHYRKLYPTLNSLTTLNDADTLSLGYSKRIKKPDPEDLNPYVNRADPNNLRRGNPDLRPQMTDALELGYVHEAGSVSYGATAFYRRSRDGDTDVLTPLDNGVVLITKANLPAGRSGGVDFRAAGKLTSSLSYNASGTVFYNEINTQASGAATSRSNVGFNGKGALDYQFGVRDRMQISANYRGKRLTPQGYNLPFGVVNLGYRHQVDDQLTLVATMSDVFNTQRMRRVYDTPDFHGEYQRHQLGQIAYLGLSYNFGGKRKAKDVEFNYD